jgi:hypothetical protein
LKERLPFLRTAKGGVARKGPDFCAFWEAVIGGLLLLGALTLVVTNYKQVHEINIFAAVMVVQSLPFIAAVAIALIEGTRFNSLAYWQALETRTGEIDGRENRSGPVTGLSGRFLRALSRERSFGEPHPI